MSISFKSKLFLALSALLAFAPISANGADAASYDVVVYGGTSAAVTTAVQVVKMGKSVVIVSPDAHLGGLSSGGLGATDSGNRAVVGGLSREFYHRLWEYYQNEDAWTFQKMPKENGIPGQGGRGIDNDTQTMWVFEPSVAEKIFEDFVREYKIPVLKNEKLDREKGVVKEGASIKSITTLSGKTFVGKRFIDATYEGDLMAAAGVTYVVGREANAQYGESLNGIQVGHAVSHQFEGFVDPYVERGKPESGLLPYVNEKINGKDGEADDRVQAYCLRMCLTNDPKNLAPIEKPDGYNELDYELLLRSIEAGQNVFMTFSPMPNYKTDSNNNKAVSTDLIGGSYRYPDASYEEREEIYQKHLKWQQGLLWTLQHNERVPQKIRDEYNKWGLAKDEFVDNGNWPKQMYVREARRMKSDFVVSERHLRYLEDTPRSIGMGSYNMDSHNIQRYVAIDAQGRATVRNEGDVQVNPGAPYPIDYGAIIPPKSECDNLLVPLCVSCTHIAFGSIRMEPVFMVLGQSAATAACLSLDESIAPQDLEYAKLQAKLLEDGQVLEYGGAPKKKSIRSDSLKGIVIDNAKAIVKGEWVSGNVTHNYVDVDYIHDDNANKDGKSVRFEFENLKPGVYACNFSYSRHDNRATNVPITVKTSLMRIETTVNEKEAPKIDGLFTELGKIKVGDDGKATVDVYAKGTNGHVIVDAVQFIPIAN
ncbi:MAG: FAD-dependent oxidoreductase [Thermoguttaceae bacterium]|nr:FAD-dependent oxidoreductase [Thermoguttaceae bacterium]